MARDVAVAAYNLSKKYAGTSTFAVRGLDFDIKRGEVYGFLGPNGAGKTTTIRMLMNFIQPTRGEAKILDLDSVNDSVEIKSKVGYLSGEIALYPKMTGRQFLEYMSDLQPPRRKDYQRQLIRLFEFTSGQKIGNLSKGNRQKLGLIQAFMHEPDILILDEPTSGLDPLMQEAFYNLVRQTKERGATLFVSSHNLTEVQKMCDRIGFIRDGKLIAEQTIGDFAKQSTQIYDISFANDAPLTELRRLSKAKVNVHTPRYISIKMQGDLTPLFAILAKHKVNSLDRQESSLEEEFLNFYKRGRQ
ncbi:MAG TPA: ABC transporter ATP-binding protein [Candidatus Saccharimonadales bacterium]|nr:ABC transporter ATP-binding protein [Candidatus Saccharimonadales bacterium]